MGITLRDTFVGAGISAFDTLWGSGGYSPMVSPTVKRVVRTVGQWNGKYPPAVKREVVKKAYNPATESSVAQGSSFLPNSETGITTGEEYLAHSETGITRGIHRCTHSEVPTRVYLPLYTPEVPTRVYTTIVHSEVTTRVYTTIVHTLRYTAVTHPGIPTVVHTVTHPGIPTVVHTEIYLPRASQRPGSLLDMPPRHPTTPPFPCWICLPGTLWPPVSLLDVPPRLPGGLPTHPGIYATLPLRVYMPPLPPFVGSPPTVS